MYLIILRQYINNVHNFFFIKYCSDKMNEKESIKIDETDKKILNLLR